jgi:HSP20 family protein
MSEKKSEQKKDDHKKKGEEQVEVDFGIGKISFGGLFEGLGSLIDLVSKIDEGRKHEEQGEREFVSPSGRVKAVYGFSVKSGGIGGRATIEPFGNVRKTSKGPVVEEEREPLVDIFDEKDHVVILIELPGIEEKQIHTEIKQGTMILSAANGERKYHKEIELPDEADVESIQQKYTNGVLEIRMNKK